MDVPSFCPFFGRCLYQLGCVFGFISKTFKKRKKKIFSSKPHPTPLSPWHLAWPAGRPRSLSAVRARRSSRRVRALTPGAVGGLEKNIPARWFFKKPELDAYLSK